MSKPKVTVSFEPEENGKLVYLAAVPMAEGKAPSSLLAFRVRIKNDGDSTVRLKKIQVVLLPLPGQPGHPPPLIFSFDRDVEIASGKTKESQIKKDEKISVPAFPISQVQIALFFAGHDEPVVSTRLLGRHKSPTPQQSYRFFGNTHDMGFDEYFCQSRHTDAAQFFEYDMKVCGWNEEKNNFTLTKPGTSGDSNGDYFGFGKPLYAMADGTVISFANDRDENPIPGERALIRLGENEAGPVNALSLFRLNNQRMATAMSTATGTLKLILWETVVNGNHITELQLSRLGDAEAETTISQVAGVALSETRLVTAVRTATGRLKVIVWSVSTDGLTITRLGEDGAGSVGRVSLAKLNSNRIAVAVQTAEGNLELIVWDISSDGLTLKRVGDEQAGAVKKACVTALSSKRVLTAVQTSGDKLKVIVWDVSGAGTVTRRGDAEGGSISDVGMALVNSNRARVVTAVRTTNGKMKLTVWETDSDGNVKDIDDLEAGEISAVAVASPKDELDDLATCVITKAGALKVNTWKSADQDDDSKVGLTRYSNNDAGAINLTDIIWLKSDETPHLIVTAVRTSGGNLKLIVWWLSGGGGNHIYLLHGNELVYFAHMMKGSLNPAVCKLGASVKQGQFVGRMGNSGSAGGPHCHIEASRAPDNMTVEQMIEEHQQGTLADKIVYRPMPFHNAQALSLSDVKPGILEDNKFALVDDQGFYWESMAIWPGSTTPGIPTGRDEIAFHGVKNGDYQRLFDRLTGANYRLIWIDGYAIGNDLRFNVLFRPDNNGDWSAHHNLTGAQYQDVFDEHKGEGRRLVHVNSYRTGSSTLYAAIFRKTEGSLPVAYHDLSLEDHQGRFESLKAEGFAPVNVSVVSINGHRRYTALYEKRNVGGFVLKSFLTPDQYQAEFDDHKDDGLQIVYLDAYQHQDGVRFSAIWNRENKGTTHGRHHLTGAQYQQEYETTTGDGFLTVSVVGYALGGQPRFAAVWRK
ncbi:MAG TPA: peptidoglycan DD-metalloendopeptidase family protein [Blastocatellia bacterium]|nr:peptidoglycan DD-metalloendopeptidase family protein [Blastocatellia bacterium]